MVGVSVPLEKDIEKNFAVIPAKWGEIAADGTLQRLTCMMDTQPYGVLGISTCNDTEPWRYYIAVSSSRAADGLEEYTVPGATWAVFPGTGTNQSIQELERRIVEHLTDEIDMEQLGRVACCSSYHFQRMFTYMEAQERFERLIKGKQQPQGKRNAQRKKMP